MSNTTTDALPTVAWLYHDGAPGHVPTVGDALFGSTVISFDRQAYRNETPLARLSDAQAIIERLTAERDAALEDARRYRDLRGTFDVIEWRKDGKCLRVNAGDAREKLDAVIDALAAQKGDDHE